MLVETYEDTEVAAEPIEIAEEAIRLIETLDLNGQTELITKREGDKRGSRCPYRLLKAEEEIVYKLLCPLRKKVQEYGAASIPLRVLHVIEDAQQYFKDLSIWYPSSLVKDPVLVARKKTSGFPNPLYLLARWGEELDEWPSLVKKALKAFVTHELPKTRKYAATLTTRVKALEHYTEADLFSTGGSEDLSVFGV